MSKVLNCIDKNILIKFKNFLTLFYHSLIHIKKIEKKKKKKKKKDKVSKNSKISTINQEHKKAMILFIAQVSRYSSRFVARNRDESTTKVNTLFTARNSAPFSSAN